MQLIYVYAHEITDYLERNYNLYLDIQEYFVAR